MESPRIEAVEWKPVARSRAHELVIDAIEDQIMSGALRVGDPLPAERDLASRLEVSRAGVREAIRVLEGQGVVRSSVGSGREAGTFIAASPSAALTRFLRLHVALSNFPVDDVTAARIMLERESARRAARSCRDEDLQRIADARQRMIDAGDDRAAFNDADTDFHVAIAEGSGNRLVADMTSAIRASMRMPNLHAMEQVADWPGLTTTLHAQHAEIEATIRAGDGELAADQVERHISSAFALLGLHGAFSDRARGGAE